MPESFQQTKRFRVPLFCLVTTLFWASLYTYTSVFTPYVRGLGASNQMAGVIVGSYGFTQLLFRIPLGIASDRFKKRRIFLTFGLIFSLISCTGLLLFKDLSLILLFRALAGAAAATWVDFTVLYTSYFNPSEATKAIGTLNFYNTVGQTAAIFFGGAAAERYGWSSPFLMGSVLAVVGLLLSGFLVEKFEESDEPVTFSGVMKTAMNRRLLCVSFLAILSQAYTFATVYGFTPQFASEGLHASKLGLSLLTVFSSLPGAFSSLLAGSRIMRKFGERRMIVFGFILTGIFTATIPFTTSFPLLILTQILAGFGRGLSFPLLMGLSIQDVEEHKRATAMGFFQAIYGLGMFLGPIIMGVIGDHASLSDGFVILGAACILTAFLTMAMVRSAKGRGRSE
jgi:MFS family permease